MDPAQVERALAIAGRYVREYFDQFPEDASASGYPHADQDRLSDLSREGASAWEAREDAFLTDLEAIDPAALAGTEAEVPYAVTRERLEASVDRRVLRTDLWNVSTIWGWAHALPVVFARQPVGTPEAREAALARVRDMARYLDVEVENLREGMRRGFTATAENVDQVRAQVDTLLAGEPEDSPFYQPATRDPDPAFASHVRAIIAGELRAAFVRYRAFLQHEYTPRAGESVGVDAFPGGAAGYRAAVRFHASISPTPEEIHEAGLNEMTSIESEMQIIARRSFGTDDVGGLLQRLRTDPEFLFSSEEEVLSCTRAAVERARELLPSWFGVIPSAEVVVQPFPAFQKRTGGGLYSASAQDGRFPATYELGTHAPETLARATAEATAFHETWPGHHLQISLAMESQNLHPVVRYLFNSGFVEGWALYSERLADEMGLYTSDLDRLGMLSNEALRAARLVVDPGLHALGWTRRDAIRYMLEHTAESVAVATYEVDRYIAGPGQATAYLLGRLEIGRLRRFAETRLGPAFDVRAFHDRLLESGSVTLALVREKVEAWVEGQARLRSV